MQNETITRVEAIKAFLPESVRWLIFTYAAGLFMGLMVGFTMGVWLVTTIWLTVK